MSQDPALAASPAVAAQPVRPAEPPDEREAKQPRAWWQWLFLYPATAAALLTAVPSWTDKFREVYHDLSGTSTTIAEALARQDRINRNMSCLASPEIWVPADNMSVDGTICDSGDILIRLVTHDGKKALDIFETSRMLAQDPPRTASAAAQIGRLFALTAEARQIEPERVEAWLTEAPLADPPADPKSTDLAQQGFAITLCQRYLDDRMLQRHVQVGGACFNETLDTYTGIVVSRKQVPCNNSCG
jgi:hypothetical protein